MNTELVRRAKIRLAATLKQLIEHQYLRDVCTLLVGTGIAQLIPILASPIITRLYTPYDYGVYAVFISTASIFGPIVCGCYEQAIILVNSVTELVRVAWLAITIAFTICFLLFVATLLFKSHIALLFKSSHLGGWLYWLPLVIFMMGVFNILNYVLIYQKRFKTISKINVSRTGFSSSSQVIFGFFSAGAAGLLVSQIGSYIVINVIAAKIGKQLLKTVEWKRKGFANLREIAKRYKDFPKYGSGSTLLNTFSFNSVNIYVGIVYSAHIVGLLALVTLIIGIPMSLIGSSFSRVFLQRASEEQKQTGSAKKSFIFTLKSLCIISIIFFTCLFFLVTPVIKIVFGARWLPAATYVKILIPFFSIRFISSVLSACIIVFEKQKLSLIVNGGVCILIMSCFFLGWFYQIPFEHFLLIYSFVLAAWYLGAIVLYYKMAFKPSEATGNKC